MNFVKRRDIICVASMDCVLEYWTRWSIRCGASLYNKYHSLTSWRLSIFASVTPAVLWSFPAKLFHAPHWKNLLNGGWLFSEMLSISISFYKLMLVNVRPSNTVYCFSLPDLMEGERKRVMDINIIYIYILIKGKRIYSSFWTSCSFFFWLNSCHKVASERAK